MDTVPFLLPKIKRKLKIDSKINSKNPIEIEEKIVDAAMKMVKSPKVTMVWSEYGSITKWIFEYLRCGKNSQFRKFNYPRAFLFFGLIRYYISRNDRDKVGEIKKAFDKLLTPDGKPTFNLDKVDQVPFGITAIELYRIYNENKYKVFFENLYQFLFQRKDINGLVFYRKGQQNQLNDLIGMVVPFLVEYYRITNNAEALIIAKKQLDFYIKYGVDKETYIPAHGINLSSMVKTGSINWGRGIGWYLLGLSSYYEVTGEYYKEFIGIKNSLEKLQLDNKLYSQFPGSSISYDASTSTMFLYSFIHLYELYKDRKELITIFSDFIDKNGYLMQTSGDTYGLNSYSETFGLSELSQGILLLLLSKTKQ